MESTVSTVSQSRAEFSAVYQEASALASTLNVPVAAPRKAGRQVHRANCGSAENAEDHYRINGWNVVVDETLAELQRRFPCDHPALKLEGILPRNVATADLNDVEAGAAFYDADLPQPSGLRSELLMWKQMCAELPDKGLTRTLTEAYQMADSVPNVQGILRILLTVPATSCSAERSFSTLKRVETDHRSTMGQKRLESLVLMSTHKRMALHPPRIVDMYVAMGPRRDGHK